MEENKDLSKMYKDDSQKAMESLKKSADKMNEAYADNPFTRQDVVLDIVFFFIVTGAAFGWLLLMLLIISFISMGYLKFKFKTMVIAAVIFAVAVAVFYIFKKINKYKKVLNNRRAK